MSRFGQTGGRFTQSYELDGIFDGTSQDLQEFAGQTLPWYVFDKANSTTDLVYDVGSDLEGGGRRWKPPLVLPVISVQRVQGSYDASVEGFYVTDSVHVSLSVREAELHGLGDLEDRPDLHMPDRFIWHGTVFSPVHIQERGMVAHRFTVIGIDAQQVNSEELVNDADPFFRRFAQPPD